MCMRFLTLFLATVLALSCNKDNPVDPGTNVDQFYFPGSTNDGWETLSPDSLGWDTTLIPDLNTLLEDNNTRAFLVLKDGKIVMEEYWGKNLLGLQDFDENKDWYWASAAKTLTSFVVGKAQEEGYLSISDATSNYLGQGWTSTTTEQENAITIEHQLTMTSGLDDGTGDPFGHEPEDLLFKAPAGERWGYHNGPYTLLDAVITEATDTDFDTYFEEVLQDKIGMSGYWSWVGDNHLYFSTARDMARYGSLMLNKGKWVDQTIMNDADYFNQMISPSQSINESYGYLWWLNGQSSFMLPTIQAQFPNSIVANAPDDMYAGIGANGQYLCVIPSKNMVVIRMGENPDQAPVPLLFINDIWEILNQIID